MRASTAVVVKVKSPSPSAAVVVTEEALIDPVCVPSVLLLVPLPKGILSLKSGRLKVDDPSPTPYPVPAIANNAA